MTFLNVQAHRRQTNALIRYKGLEIQEQTEHPTTLCAFNPQQLVPLQTKFNLQIQIEFKVASINYKTTRRFTHRVNRQNGGKSSDRRVGSGWRSVIRHLYCCAPGANDTEDNLFARSHPRRRMITNCGEMAIRENSGRRIGSRK